MSAVLEVRDLNKSFGGIVVADAIDLTLPAGRVLGLIGPNGAGKTSLFNLSSGIFPADAARSRLMANAHRPAQDVQARAARIGPHLAEHPSLSVPVSARQSHCRVSPLSGRRWCRLALGQAGIRREDAQTRRKSARHPGAVRLRGRCRQDRRRPHIRAAEARRGREGADERRSCLLLDEPMAGVEGQAYATMQRVVRDVAASGVAVGVVEHNVAFIRDLCDEGVFMFSGKVLARGSVADLIADSRSQNSTSEPELMLEIDSISAGYGSLTALETFLPACPTEARLGIFGHNGAGKTTLLSCIIGAHAPSCGKVRFNGEPVHTGQCRRTCGAGSPSCPRGTTSSRTFRSRRT